MSILVSHDRNYWKIEEKPSGVYRILCLGDSMTYGAGVQPDETLPEQLETFLNRAVWGKQIEVINHGVSGYALYDDWYRFMHKGYRYQPDLVVIVLCDNDIELFSVNDGIQQKRELTYENHVAECWQEDGLHYKHFREALKSISLQMKEHNIPVILAYYDIWSPPVRGKIVSTLKNICDEYKLGFVDFSEDFLDKQSAHEKKHLKVSEADGHPSAEAHRQTAQKLARYIIENKYLENTDEETPSESELVQTIIDNSRDMHRLGYRPEYVYYNTRRLLDLKHACKYRTKLGNDRLLPEEFYGDIRSDFEQLTNHQQQQMFWEAYARWLDLYREQLFYLNHNAEDSINRISKGLFVLGNLIDRKSDMVLNFFNDRKDKFDHDYFNRIPGLLQRWTELLKGAQTHLDRSDSMRVDNLNTIKTKFAINPPISNENVNRRIKSTFQEFEISLQALFTLYKSYADLFGQAQLLDNVHVKDTFLGLAQAINELSQMIDDFTILTHLERLSKITLASSEKPVTTCQIRLASTSEKPLSLWLQLKSIYPERKPISEMRWIVCDGNSHTYRFELPLCFLGEASLVVHPENKAVLEYIEFFNNPEVRHRLDIPPEKAGLNSQFNIPPFLLFP